MENTFPSCPLPVNARKTWPYHQYYYGKQDQEKRRNGHGQNHWSGAESLEWYTGKFVRDVMHGDGEYRWRYLGPEGTFITYEGPFYGNRMHGYGVMSYPDGKVFNGLFYHNMRWGPGVESYSNIQENVGLWHGSQLVRLVWRPNASSVTLDLNNSLAAKKCVEPFRSVMSTRIKTIGEVNSAIELLKQNGADPISASEKWTKLYPKYCTDLASQLCHNELFDYEYYKTNIFELEEDQSFTGEIDRSDSEAFYAWNNSGMMISMMKHCFKHEKQRSRSEIDLKSLLTGPRNRYKRAAKHEIDCRTLLLASYLGELKNVVRLVNENNVHPDVADVLGNTALMYATVSILYAAQCGNQTDILHFLVEAGANVNSFNDSCCTPLGVALIKYMCGCKYIATSDMIQALLPPPSVPAEISLLKQNPIEWHITRDLSVQSAERLTTAPKGISLKNKSNKSKIQLDTAPKERKRSKIVNEAALPKERRKNNTSNNSIVTEMFEDEPADMIEQTNEEKLLRELSTEFSIKVTDVFTSKIVMNPVPYLFEVTDMIKAVDMIKEHRSSLNGQPKPLVASKSVKETISKPTKDATRQVSEKDSSSEHSIDQAKIKMLSDNMSTIVQLLSNGADPRLMRYPQPALRIALASGAPDLLRLLVKYGADVNEVYPKDSNLTLLDMAISQPLTYESLAQTQAILECGAITDHRLEYPAANDSKVPGPTLLHAVVAKQAENYIEEQIRCQLLELLLEYNCDALAQFDGCSAIDLAMMKDISLLEIFVKSPKVDPNAIINDQNQTILVKMFSPYFCSRIPISERLQILTNLMLYAADPLLECQDGDKKYPNFFVFANYQSKTASGVAIITAKPTTTNIKTDAKGKKPNIKAKESNEKQTKLAAKPDDTKDFSQALDLVNNCVRILHVRWIHAKLLKELIKVVTKYEHRYWNMILPEYRNKKACGLWLSSPRTLEIWEILKSNKKKNFNDRRILKHVLCIVHFNSNRSKTSFKTPLTAQEKDMIENDVCCMLREHKVAANMSTDTMHFLNPYVTPELAVGADIKFQVCFECHLPLEEEKIVCINCRQVSFCSHECMKANVDIKAGYHPCSEYLKTKYFSSTTESVSLTDK